MGRFLQQQAVLVLLSFMSCNKNIIVRKGDLTVVSDTLAKFRRYSSIHFNCTYLECTVTILSHYTEKL